MPDKYINLESISDLHKLYNAGKPRHPLVTVIDLAAYRFKKPEENTFLRLGFYSVFCKQFNGNLRYGRSNYDFSEGSLMFTAPGQVTAPSLTPASAPTEGWGLFFHPDLLHGYALGLKINTYSFFNYEANEALHISEE